MTTEKTRELFSCRSNVKRVIIRFTLQQQPVIKSRVAVRGTETSENCDLILIFSISVFYRLTETLIYSSCYISTLVQTHKNDFTNTTKYFPSKL